MAGLRDVFSNLILKRPARRLTLAGHAARLEASGARLGRRFEGATNSEANRKQLRHLIGIERWGQRRLGTLLGQPPLADEHDGYRPAAGLEWSALCEDWTATRRETVALAGRLAAAGVGDDRTARHNAQGELTAREWLRYLTLHANIEALRVRR